MRYFFHTGYRGAGYRGWQKQPAVISVQQTVESCLEQVLKIPVGVVGCGRTDAGVHAAQFFFHADLLVKNESDLLFRLNKSLPKDIAVYDIIPVNNDQHARFDAFERHYKYFFHTFKDPFLSQVSSHYAISRFDVDKIRSATKLITQYHDFRAFCKSPNKNKHTVCDVYHAEFLTDHTGQRFLFEIRSNRFLTGMVRILVSKLLEIGLGQLSLDQFEQHLFAKTPFDRLKPAYPEGLFLAKINYPFLDIPVSKGFKALSEFYDAPNYWKPI